MGLSFPACMLVVMLLAALHEAVCVCVDVCVGPLVRVCFALTRTKLHPFSPLTSVCLGLHDSFSCNKLLFPPISGLGAGGASS